MLGGYENETKPPMPAARKLWLGFSIIILGVLVYIGWVFYSRWHENRELTEKAAVQLSEKEQKDAAATVETLGGTEFKIIAFYVSPVAIRRGETVTMCYGVSNAKSVQIDPPVGNTWPSVNRCMEVTPKKTTKYTLTTDDGKGDSKSAEVTVVVQ
jgi:hypothetical protein